ncbi:MAG: NRDE family protein [Terriglobales bacterium]
MCTLSVITRDDGYLLAMNRDEKIARGAGELPQIHRLRLNGTTAAYPSDGAGGTWIAANEYGVALALLNWNDVVQPEPGTSKVRSRGEIIPILAGAPSLTGLQSAFAAFNLDGIRPFRLVAVVPSERAIAEWGWDSSQLAFQTLSWHSRHWFSSSLTDRQAGILRGAVCRDAQHELDAGSAPWLRRLHASHTGGPGPFSLCVHRDDVKTLSYSEIAVAPERIQMGHFRGSPCARPQLGWTEIRRVYCADPAVTSFGGSAV